MHIKISPMQNLPIMVIDTVTLKTVEVLIVTVSPTKVLSDPADSLRRTGDLFLHTCLPETVLYAP